MKRSWWMLCAVVGLWAGGSVLLVAPAASAQENCYEPAALFPLEPNAASASPLQQPTTSQSPNPPSSQNPPTSEPAQQTGTTKPSEQQPPRILGVMPNFRAVSAGAIPPPPTAKEAFVIATQNSFDYSSFIFVGLTSLIAKGTDAHPQLGKGPAGYGRYYWRGFVDKADGNYLVIFAFATVLHEDQRYYAMGHGKFVKRFVYSATRIFITPNYEGENTLNAAELLGRGIAQGVSLAYYPSQTRTWGAISEKYGYALLRDAATNIFREFWPDIATHVLHRHP
jgi:hypothetical protein